MKLSENTLAVLKNFASINSGVVLKKGNTQKTISPEKSILVEATLEDNLNTDFGIYDLNEFLGAMSLFEDPGLDFSDKYVTIKQGNSSIKYFAAEASVLTAPQKAITFPDTDIEFNLTANMLEMIRKTAGVLRASDVAIVGDGSTITAVVGDKKNATGNSFQETLGSTDKQFKVYLKVDNLKMVPGDYTVSISSKKISRFKGAGDLVYYVAVEADSVFSN